MTRTLVVGAGAVGLTMAHALAGSGDVTLLVRAARREALSAEPPAVHRRQRRWEPSPLAADVRTATELTGTFATVVVTVPSGALDEALLTTILRVSDARTIIVSLQPRTSDWELIARRCAGRRLVRGRIGFLAWLTPVPGLPGSSAGAGWYAFPGTATLLGGDAAAAREVAARFKRGGLPCRAAGAALPDVEAASALLVPFVALLELEDWSFARAPHSAALPVARAAAVQRARSIGALAVASLAWLALRPLALAAALRATRLAPLDLERFFAVHFSKVGEQTELQLEAAAEAGVTEMRELAARLRAHRRSRSLEHVGGVDAR